MCTDVFAEQNKPLSSKGSTHTKTDKTHFFASSGCSNISHFEVVTAKEQTQDSITETKNSYNRTGDNTVLKYKLFRYYYNFVF